MRKLWKILLVGILISFVVGATFSLVAVMHKHQWAMPTIDDSIAAADTIYDVNLNEEWIAASDECWEVPEDWRLPDSLHDALDESLLWAASVEDTNALLYALYAYFGSEIEYVLISDEAVRGIPNGVYDYWVVQDRYEDLYLLWKDNNCSFIKKVERQIK